MDYGVPQGTIFGPLFFILFINDMHTCVSDSLLLLYADDATVLFSHKDSNVMVSKLNDNLASIKRYCHNNKLLINTSKTKVLYFKSANRNLDIKLDTSIVGIVTSFKLLGVHIDNNLNFASHISHLLKKLNSCIYVLH